MAHLIDLSHVVEHGMTTYPGLPAPVIEDFLSRERSRENYRGQAEFQIGRITLIANTGTYLDTPFHRFDGGTDLADLSLSSMADLPGVLVDARGGLRAIDVDRFAGIDLAGRAVVVLTGWSEHFRSQRYGAPDHPFITAAAAQHLADAGATLVGIDSVNIDDMADPSRPAHTILLRNQIPIVEHLTNLRDLVGRTFRFFAVPPRVRGMGTFMVRAFAMIE